MVVRRIATARAATLLVVGLAVGAGSATAQRPASIVGRVFDTETGEGIGDVVVSVEGMGIGTVTNDIGLFQIPVLPPGTHLLVVSHIAYGERKDSIRARAGQRLTVRINLSMSAIELSPLVVEGTRAEVQAERARGSASNVVTRDQIEAMLGSSPTLDQVLARHVTGVVVKHPSIRGGDVCVEFRSPRSLQDPLGCKTPTVFLDGVRISNPQPLWDTFPVEEIQRMEVVPSVEAGVRYGADTNYGVLVIETRTGGQVMGLEEVAPAARGTYDWALESHPYPWFKVFATSFVLNGLGLAAGSLIGQGCFQFDEGLSNSHFFLETQCGRVASGASAVALFGLPVMGASFGATRSGRTELSHGKWVPSAVAAGMAVVPGYILVVAKNGEAFAGSKVLGWGLLTVGAPLFSTLADRLFRVFTDDPLRDLR